MEFGALGQGDVVSLYNYLAMILVELIKLANLIVTLTKAVSSQKRIGQVLEMESEPSVSLPEVEKKEGGFAVEFENVTFAYGQGAPALKEVAFCVKRGETVGILGGTGSGKSTLVNLIPRFYEAKEGRVLLDGRDVRTIPAEELRERVGVAAQKSVLFQGTIRSNLLWGKGDATDEELMLAVGCAQAEDVVKTKGGLDGEVVKKPEILILDDTSSALDYATDAKLRKAIALLGGTVFIVSQRVSSVMHADKIVVLDDGAVAGMGTHGELMKSSQVYREIYETQFRERA